MGNVSVPSRGLSYLNMNPPGGMGLKKNSFRPLTGTLLSKQSLINLKIMQRELSVPSRGLSYLNDIKKYQDKYAFLFPSPHGDSLI